MRAVCPDSARAADAGIDPFAAPVIRAVLFDFDGVLTTDPSGSHTTVAALARTTGLSRELVWRALAPFNDDLLHGRTTHAAIWPAFCTAVGEAVPFEQLLAAFASTPVDGNMLDLARRLRRHCRVGIVTDNKADRIAHVVAQHGLGAVFDPIVVSADCGCTKDGPAIFRHALTHLGTTPASTLFIDNSARNLVAPQALGMHTLHFDDATRDVDGLASTLRTRFGLDC